MPVPEPVTDAPPPPAADPAALAELVAVWPEPAIVASAEGSVLAWNEDARRLLDHGEPDPPPPLAELLGDGVAADLAAGKTELVLAPVPGRPPLRLRARALPDGRLVVALADGTAEERIRDHIDQAERLASIGELLSSVAHELNNPLTSVLGFAEILLADDDPALPRSELECIREEAERCRRIVKNLLDLARAEKLQMQPLLLQDVVHKVEEFRAYAAQARGVELCTEIEADLPFVEGDFHRLVQATLNLATNAEHAVSERDRDGRVVLRARRCGAALAIEVEDNGRGIAPDSRDRIFEPFFTTKPRGQGTGLGLSLVRATAEAHGGAVRVERAASGGARFVLELPIADDAGG